MSLHFALKMNGTTLGYFEAHRREINIPSGRICTYDVIVVQNAKKTNAVITHNYDDGPFSLVAQALQALDYQPLVDEHEPSLDASTMNEIIARSED